MMVSHFPQKIHGEYFEARKQKFQESDLSVGVIYFKWRYPP